MRVEARSNSLILDVADKATVAHVSTAGAVTDDVIGCRDEASGYFANDRVVAAAGEPKASTFTDSHIEAPATMHSAPQSDQCAVEAFASLKLTPREAEVLFWIAQGKSNHDIGIILGAKTGTICKHVEHIFGKLNVENRTAAAVVALETYRSVAPVSYSTPGQPWATIAGFITTQFCALWSDSPELYGEIARLVA
jgi:DNA-binding CsgD family transcriptional regulator